MAKKNNYWIYELGVLLCCMLWGIGNPLVKVGLRTLTTFYYSLIRFSFGLVLFLLLFPRRIFRAVRRDNLKHVLIISFFNAVEYIFGTLALSLSAATVASFLMSLSVIFVPFIAYFAAGKRISPALIPAIALSVAGTYLMCGNMGQVSFGWGEVIALLCSVSMACGMVFANKYGDENIDLSYLAAMQCLLAAVLSLPLFLLSGEAWIPFASYNRDAVLCVVFTVVGSTCLTFVLQNLTLRHLSPTVASITFASESVFTMIFSYLILREALPVIGVLGGMLILGGVVLATLIQNGAIGKKKG